MSDYLCFGKMDIQMDDKYFVTKLREYPFLQEAGNEEKKHQLFLMVQQGCSGTFIDRAMKAAKNSSAADLDFLRMLTLFAGEEEVTERYISSGLTAADAVADLSAQIIAAHFDIATETKQMQDRCYKAVGAVEKLEEVLKKMQEEMGESTRLHYEKLLTEQKDKYESEMADMKLFYENEKAALINEGDTLRENIMSLQDQLDQANQELSIAQVTAPLIPVPEKTDNKARDEPLTWKQKRDRQARERYFERILSDNRFDEEQLPIIRRVASSPLELTAARKICRPDLPPANMLALEGYFYKKYMEDEYEKRKNRTGSDEDQGNTQKDD